MGIGAGAALKEAPFVARYDDLSVIDGDFVRLRSLRVEDAEQTLGWRQSPRAFLLHRGAETLEQQRAWISKRPATELNYVIETRANVPLGMLSLIDIDPLHRRAEAARFLIGDEESAKGIPAAVEAMKLLYGVAFDRLGLLRVYGTVVEQNGLMLKWQQYLGMKVEGRLRSHAFIHGRFQDLINVGILVDEYRTVALPRMNSLIAMAARSRATPPEGDLK